MGSTSSAAMVDSLLALAAAHRLFQETSGIDAAVAITAAALNAKRLFLWQNSPTRCILAITTGPCQ